MSDTPRTDSKTLAEAMGQIAILLQTDDGVANAAIAEAANRITELERELAEAKSRLDNVPVLLENNAKLRRELAEMKAWIACVAPKYEALALPHLEKPVEQWPDAVVGCRAILETCPLDQWDRDNINDEINREENQNG